METMWFVRINMTDLTARVEPATEAYMHLGGRGVTSTLVAEEVPPLCHPLGPNNKLVFSPGMVTGTVAPTSARVSVGGKSPLTGGIKEANAGSSWARDVAVMRIKALVIEGQPKQKGKFWGIHLSWDARKRPWPKVEFFDATEFAGKDLYDVYPKIYERFGKQVSIAGCGIAGEQGYVNSGVVFNDESQRPSRYAGRGGLGAVMGSKGLKFIVVDGSDAPGVPIADKHPSKFRLVQSLPALRTWRGRRSARAANTSRSPDMTATL